jgi:GNAT superfamily N-acetyltransferase
MDIPSLNVFVSLDGKYAPHLKQPWWDFATSGSDPEYTIYLSENEESEPESLLRLFKRTLVFPRIKLLAWGIGWVYTKPEYRGKGLGLRLLSETIALMENDELPSRAVAILYSRDRDFYRRAGFVPLWSDEKQLLWGKSLIYGVEITARTNAPVIEPPGKF